MKSQFGSIFAHSGINAKGVMAEGVRVVGFMGGVCLCRKSGVSRVWCRVRDEGDDGTNNEGRWSQRRGEYR